ncbi:hypothetical protein OIU85_010538 [Salix viminalis]|uniref:Uncharacterized protein n=1 Tax=Salix viminalis TaxID=40686 RepID=A0A9Q0NWV6_SALVM|nr:hypothetical protein OIU85_010538 [Salix viminalis]
MASETICNIVKMGAFLFVVFGDGALLFKLIKLFCRLSLNFLVAKILPSPSPTLQNHTQGSRRLAKERERASDGTVTFTRRMEFPTKHHRNGQIDCRKVRVLLGDTNYGNDLRVDFVECSRKLEYQAIDTKSVSYFLSLLILND